jgi:hypothetical protein
MPNKQKDYSGTGLWPVGKYAKIKNFLHRLEACATQAIGFKGHLLKR